jgi:hypothetical protein
MGGCPCHTNASHLLAMRHRGCHLRTWPSELAIAASPPVCRPGGAGQPDTRPDREPRKATVPVLSIRGDGTANVDVVLRRIRECDDAAVSGWRRLGLSARDTCTPGMGTSWLVVVPPQAATIRGTTSTRGAGNPRIASGRSGSPSPGDLLHPRNPAGDRPAASLEPTRHRMIDPTAEMIHTSMPGQR